MDVERLMAAEAKADAADARFLARMNAEASTRQEGERVVVSGGYSKRSKAKPPAKVCIEKRPPTSPPAPTAYSPPPPTACTACPTAPAPTAGSPPRASRWTRPPPPKTAAKGKAWVPPVRVPRPSCGTLEERNAILRRCFWRCFRCDFDNYGERQICNKCRVSAVGHVLFDPESQHINPITCFYTLGPVPGTATSDTPGAASSGANDAAMATTPTSAATAVGGAAEEGEPAAKRNRMAPPVAAAVDMHTLMHTLLAAIDRRASAPPAAAGMQPANVAWLSAAPPAYQEMASSLLASGAAAARARAIPKTPAV